MSDKTTIEDYYTKIEFKEDYYLSDQVMIKKGSVLENAHVVVTVGDYSIDEYDLKRILEDHGYCVLDEEPDGADLKDFSDEELLEELRERKYKNQDIYPEDLGWYLKHGRYDEFLIFLERSSPEHFGGLSKLKLTK